jgi:hypothetical protein
MSINNDILDKMLDSLNISYKIIFKHTILHADTVSLATKTKMDSQD